MNTFWGNIFKFSCILLSLNATLLFADGNGQKNAKNKFAFLSLQDAIDSSMGENFELIYQRYEVVKSEESIEVAESEFDYIFGLSVDAEKVKQPNASSTLDGSPSPESDNLAYDFDIKKKTGTGAILTVGTNSDRYSTNSTYATINPDYSSYFTVGISQPLLKGAWEVVNLAPLALSHSHKRQSELELKKKILDVMLQTENAYWDLSAAYALRKLKQSNLDLAKSLLEENEVKFNLGLIRRSDVIQAQANLASEEEQIITADQLIQERRDVLLSILGELKFDRNPNFEVLQLSEKSPSIPNFKKIVSDAIASDMDMQIRLEYIMRSQIERNVAEQNLNPDLRINANGSLRGRDQDFLNSYDSTVHAKGYGASVGLSITFPLGLRQEHANLAKASIDLRQSQLTMAQVQQTLMLNLRNAHRNLIASIEKKRVTFKSLKLNEESFNQQKALYDAGACSFRDVLSAQSDLDTAKQRYLNSLVDISKNNATLSRYDGSILQKNGFSWDRVKDREDRNKLILDN